MKRCLTCKIIKLLIDFPLYFYKRNNKKYHGSYCQNCLNHKKGRSKYFMKYRNKPGENVKHNARRKAQQAVKSKKLIKQPCINCKEPKSQMHHKDYSKPLDITWLCNKCHKQEHRRLKQEVLNA